MSSSIHIVCIGKKARLLEGEAARYVKLIRPYAGVRVSCVKPAGGKGDDSLARVKEGEALRARWSAGAYPVALAAEGEMLDSRSFAARLGRQMASGGEVTFTIGGAYGLDEGIKRACRETMSLSRLTLPHALCLAVLLEQLYRACTILKGHPYHK
jgi:23S rRNA (pseudouridine1915-N3)-methyltransferase